MRVQFTAKQGANLPELRWSRTRQVYSNLWTSVSAADGARGCPGAWRECQALATPPEGGRVLTVRLRRANSLIGAIGEFVRNDTDEGV